MKSAMKAVDSWNHHRRIGFMTFIPSLTIATNLKDSIQSFVSQKNDDNLFIQIHGFVSNSQNCTIRIYSRGRKVLLYPILSLGCWEYKCNWFASFVGGR